MGFGGGGAGSSSVTLIKLARVQASGASQVLSSGVLPDTYDNYLVIAEVQSAAAVWRIRFNGDNSNIYQQSIIENGVFGAGTPRTGIAGSISGGSAQRYSVSFMVRNRDATKQKTVYNGWSTLFVGTNQLLISGNWPNLVDLINEISLENATVNWSADSVITVYGWNDPE